MRGVTAAERKISTDVEQVCESGCIWAGNRPDANVRPLRRPVMEGDAHPSNRGVLAWRLSGTSMRRVEVEEVEEWYRDFQRRHKHRELGQNDEGLACIAAHRAWHGAELPLQVFGRLLVVARDWSKPLFPLFPCEKRRLLSDVAFHAPLVLRANREPFECVYDDIEKLRCKFAEGEVPERLILKEIVRGEEPHDCLLAIQDGNHRAIAYSIALLESRCSYSPLLAYIGSELDACSPYARTRRLVPGSDCGAWKAFFPVVS